MGSEFTTKEPTLGPIALHYHELADGGVVGCSVFKVAPALQGYKRRMQIALLCLLCLLFVICYLYSPTVPHAALRL